MAKNFAKTFLIFLAVALFMVAIYFLVLFLAPGAYILGLKYIRSGTHEVKNAVFTSANCDEMRNFNKIVLETGEVPVDIIFSDQGSGYKIEYIYNYEGITSSNVQDPKIELSRNEFGDLIVKTTEFKKFLYESSSSKRTLKIHIPISEVAVGGPRAYKKSLVINSKNSNVLIEKNEDERIPTLNKLTINTNGQVKYDTKLMAKTYEYSTNNTITIKKDKTKDIDADNYILNSNKGRIVIESAVKGDVLAKTQSGDIKLISCKNLKVETKDGDVVCFDKKSDVLVNGIVNINSRSGRVYLDEVKGLGENIITTGTGEVKINKINSGEIKTEFGSVTIKSLNNMKISTNLGKIKVEEVLTGLKADTKRGDILIGGPKMVVNNVYATSRMGEIDIKNASGIGFVETIYSDVNFENNNCSEITIHSGGKVNAKGLTGKTVISAEKDSVIAFRLITHDVDIKFGEKVKNAEIRAVENYLNKLNYYLKGKKVTQYADNGTGGYNALVSQSEMSGGSGPKIKVVGENAIIGIYTKDPNK